MNAREQAAQRLECVLGEAARLSEIVRVGADPEVLRDAMFHSIQHADGFGIIPIGEVGFDALRDLAREALNRSGLRNRIGIDEAIQFLRKNFAKIVVANQNKDSLETIDILLRDTGRAMAKTCNRRVHFYPLRLIADQTPDIIDLGVVKLLSKNTMAIRLDSLEADASNKEDPADQHGKKFREQTFNHYRSFNWVAEVEVDACDAATSRALGIMATRQALNFLRLIIGRQWTTGFSSEVVSHDKAPRYHLSVDADDSLGLEWTTAGVHERNFENELPKVLSLPDESFFMDMARCVLQATVEANPTVPLSIRYLDALQWFGEAASESQPAAAIVKYSLCLERLLMTEERENTTATLVERVAALGMPGQLRSSSMRDDLRKRMRKAYDLRSRIVHGSISPADPKVLAGLATCAELAERILKMYLVAFSEEKFRSTTFRSARLAKWFDDLSAILEEELNASTSASR